MSIESPDVPLGIEVRHLIALEAVAQTGSFSRAAIRLGYAQSAISQQISALERSIGHRLVERPGGPRPVSLTDAGRVLLSHASFITARLVAAKADLDALTSGTAGLLRLGTFQSASARLLPPTFARFRTEWPNINVEVRSEQVGVPVDTMVRSGKADLAFADVTDLDESFGMVGLLHDPSVLITPPDHPLARSEIVDVALLSGERMVSTGIDDICAQRALVALGRAGVEPDIVFRSDDNLTTQRLVASGLGVAIVPLLAVEQSIPDAVVAIRALSVPVARQLGIIWQADRAQSRAAEAFITTATEVSRSVVMPTVPSLS